MSVAHVDLESLERFRAFLVGICHEVSDHGILHSRPAFQCESYSRNLLVHDPGLVMVMTQENVQVWSSVNGELGTYELDRRSSPAYTPADLDEGFPIDTSSQSSTTSADGSYESSFVDDTVQSSQGESTEEEELMDLDSNSNEADEARVVSDQSTSESSDSDGQSESGDA